MAQEAAAPAAGQKTRESLAAARPEGDSGRRRRLAGTARASLAFYNSQEDLRLFSDALRKVLHMLI